METYNQDASGILIDSKGRKIPVNSARKKAIFKQVETGEAEIISYIINLVDHKISRMQYINISRDNVINSGVDYGGNTYDTSQSSRENLAGVHSGVNDGYVLPPGFTWRTADNVNILFTAMEINGLAHAFLSHVNTQYNVSWTLKSQVDIATTIAEVDAIVWP